MSQAASQASRFFEEVARQRRAYTVFDQGHHIALPMHNGDVIPYWSSRSRIETVQRVHPKYSGFEVREIPLERLLGELLPRFEADGLRIGVNWSGPGLTGFDYSVADLRRNLEHWLQKLGSR